MSQYLGPIAYDNGRRGTKNLVTAHPQRMTSADGKRWACGRNQKMHLPHHRYEAVECWSLKHRVDGKAVTVSIQRSREAAEAWIAGGAA